MILKNCDIKTFHNKLKDKTLICYGVGYDFKKMLKNTAQYPWNRKIKILVDNAIEKNGTEELIQGVSIRILDFDSALKEWSKDNVILITCSFYYEIIIKLNQIKQLENTECYIYNFMINKSVGERLAFKMEGEFKIPSTIHYCWFGRKPIPDLYKRCIESWYKYCPDYQIVEWNEDNCDLNDNLYARQAYERGKYGFVPDYFRLKIIYEKGGIYLDTDVEVVKNLDPLRRETAFCGLELPGEVAFGLGFGASKGNKQIERMLETYNKLNFILEDGTLNETISPVYQTKDLLESGMLPGNELQKVGDMVIYPTEVLSPKNLYTGLTEITEYTFMIHHFDGSWVSGERLIRKEKRLKEAIELQGMFVE